MADEILTVRVDSSSVGVARRDLAGLNTVLGQSERLLRNVTSVSRQMSREVTTLQRNTKILRGELEDTSDVLDDQTSAFSRSLDKYAADARTGMAQSLDAYAKLVKADKAPGAFVQGALQGFVNSAYTRHETGQPIGAVQVADLGEENIRGLLRFVMGTAAKELADWASPPKKGEGEKGEPEPDRPDFLRRTATSAGDALIEYSKSMGDTAKETEAAFTKAFQGAEDALYSFVTTGKANFSDLASSLISDLARIALRQAVVAPLLGALGGMFRGLGASGGIGAATATDVAAAGGGLMFLSRGGYTGDGPRDRIAGVVHGQEFVLNAEATRRMGRAQLESLNAGGPLAMSGEARTVGASSSPVMQMLTGTGSSIQVAVQIHGAGQVQSTAPEGYEQFAQDIGQYIDQRFNQLEARSQRQGGMAWRQRNGWN